MIEQTNTNEQTGLNEQAHTNEQTEVDFAFDDSPSACSAEETIAENPVAPEIEPPLVIRLRQINHHRMYIAGCPGPGKFVMRGVCADLMEMEANIAESVRTDVTETPITGQNFEQYSPRIDFLLRLAKVISHMEKNEAYVPKR